MGSHLLCCLKNRQGPPRYCTEWLMGHLVDVGRKSAAKHGLCLWKAEDRGSLGQGITLWNGVCWAHKYNPVTQWGEKWWFWALIDRDVGPMGQLRVKPGTWKIHRNLWFRHIMLHFSDGKSNFVVLPGSVFNQIGTIMIYWWNGLPGNARKGVVSWRKM